MAVAVTSTVNLIFGSQVMDPVTGILFNDEVCDIAYRTRQGDDCGFPRWMIFPRQEFRMHSAFGPHRVRGHVVQSLNYIAHRSQITTQRPTSALSHRQHPQS
jgi:hypothetical protein